jgi:hypothetical protein
MRAQCVVIALAALAVAAPSAEAKIYFAEMNGRVLHWDQRVSSTILGCPRNASCGEIVEGHTVYLRRGPVGSRDFDRHRLRRLGRISASGTLRFRTRHWAAGRYHLVARVPAGERRLWMSVSGYFRIRR